MSGRFLFVLVIQLYSSIFLVRSSRFLLLSASSPFYEYIIVTFFILSLRFGEGVYFCLRVFLRFVFLLFFYEALRKGRYVFLFLFFYLFIFWGPLFKFISYFYINDY